jgi:hypothetical protein
LPKARRTVLPGAGAGSRNKKTLAAAVLLEGEAETLTHRVVDLALAGNPTAMRLCIERILPRCRERAVEFALPPVESAADIAPAMKTVTSALAASHHAGRGRHLRGGRRHLCPGETSDCDRRLKIMEAELPRHPGDVPEMFGRRESA